MRLTRGILFSVPWHVKARKGVLRLSQTLRSDRVLLSGGGGNGDKREPNSLADSHTNGVGRRLILSPVIGRGDLVIAARWWSARHCRRRGAAVAASGR